MREFVRLQTRILLRRLASQLTRTARTGEADDIHDLRVAIRRLSRCLRVFAAFYPGNSSKKLRRRLAGLMEACGNVRDRDIALGLLERAGVPATSPLARHLAAQRDAASLQLHRELLRWKDRAFSGRWRVRLEL